MSGWIVETLFASTVLMIVVLALRHPVRVLFGPRLAYALWLLPALRMILPPLPQIMVEAAPLTPLPMRLQTALPLAELPALAPLPHPASAPADWTFPLAMVWLAGAFLCIAVSARAYIAFLRRIRAAGQTIGTVDGLTIWASEAIDGPLAFGVLRQAVAVPGDYATRYAAGEFALALRHEAMHHRRRDLIVNMIALAVRALHWFNPVAYWAHRAFRTDQELACDAAVLSGETPDERHAYACALVKSAGARLPAAACAMNGKGQLKRRLGMMNRKGNSPRRALAGATAIAAIMVAGLGLTASGSIAATEVQRLPAKIARVVAPPPVAPLAPPAAPARLAQEDVPQAPAAPDAARLPQPPAPPQAGEAPEAPEAAEAPEAPEAPEPPEAPENGRGFKMADIDAIVQSSLARAEASIAQARAQVAKCTAEHGRAKCGGVDMSEIRRDVVKSLREAQRDLRDDDIPADIRARVVASLDGAIARIQNDPRWR